jgi:hypothetical protein
MPNLFNSLLMKYIILFFIYLSISLEVSGQAGINSRTEYFPGYHNVLATELLKISSNKYLARYTLWDTTTLYRKVGYSTFNNDLEPLVQNLFLFSDTTGVIGNTNSSPQVLNDSTIINIMMPTAIVPDSIVPNYYVFFDDRLELKKVRIMENLDTAGLLERVRFTLNENKDKVYTIDGIKTPIPMGTDGRDFYQVYLRTYDLEGKRLASKHLPRPSNFVGAITGNSELICRKGSIYFGGSYLNYYYRENPADFFLRSFYYKMDLEGNILKSYFSPENKLCSIYESIMDKKQNSYLEIYEGVIIPFGSEYATLPSYGVTKLDSNLNWQWTRFFKDSIWGFEVPYFITGIAMTHDEKGVVLYGNRDIEDVNDPPGYNAAVIIKYDEIGNRTWTRHIYHSRDTLSQQVLYRMEATDDGGFIGVGSVVVWDNTINGGDQRGWRVKLDEYGCITPGCQVVPTKEYEQQKVSMSLYPNPCDNQLTVRIYKWEKGDGTIEIYDVQGRRCKTVKTAYPQDYELVIDVADLLPGSYVIRYISSEKVITSSKFVKM